MSVKDSVFPGELSCISLLKSEFLEFRAYASAKFFTYFFLASAASVAKSDVILVFVPLYRSSSLVWSFCDIFCLAFLSFEQLHCNCAA